MQWNSFRYSSTREKWFEYTVKLVHTCTIISALSAGFILQFKHTKNCFSTFKKCLSQKQSKKTAKWCKATSSTILNTEIFLWLFCETFMRFFSQQPRYETWLSAHTCTYEWWSDTALRTSTWLSGQRSDQRRKEKARKKVRYVCCIASVCSLPLRTAPSGCSLPLSASPFSL